MAFFVAVPSKSALLGCNRRCRHDSDWHFFAEPIAAVHPTSSREARTLPAQITYEHVDY